MVPVGSAVMVTSPTGSCATGWSSCAPSAGGNCCPSGYGCGTASCSLVSASSTEVVQKASPNVGSVNKRVIGVGCVLIWMSVMRVMI